MVIIKLGLHLKFAWACKTLKWKKECEKKGPAVYSLPESITLHQSQWASPRDSLTALACLTITWGIASQYEPTMLVTLNTLGLCIPKFSAKVRQK